MAGSRPQRIWEFTWDVAQSFSRDRCPFLAAGVCYFVVFSIFPLLLGTLAILGYLVSPEWALAQIHAGLGQAIPSRLGFLPGVIDQVVADRGPSGAIALVLLVWSGRGVFMCLGEALDIIWNAQESLDWRDNVRRNVLALAMAVGLGGAVIALSVLYGGLALVMNYRIAVVGLRPSELPGVLWVLSNVLPVGLIGLGLLLVYRLMPIRHLPLRAIFLGAASAAVLWELSRRLFGLYLDHFARLSVVYGPLSGIIGFMIWVYVSAMIFLLGAELAARFARSNSPSAR